MAKTTAPKNPRRVVATSEDDEEPLTPTEAGEEDGEGETEPTVTVGKAPTVEEPKVETDGGDMVQFVCYEEVDPAPVVGHYKFRDNGVMKLERTKTYLMPRDVAMHLVDRKKGTIVSG